ncbi:MAG TPA: DNA alkylation repair protein [Actinobacteria bacterium]|nr:DNA alkylation repair protein [Actinomycetota bacterium]
MNYDDVVEKLKSLSNPETIEGMARFGITPERTYGVSIPNLRKIAKEIGRDHNLAQELWESNIRETRVLASIVDESNKVTEEQMESWAREFDCWEICDQCCMNLFGRTKFVYQKVVEWSSREGEFVKRAGFVLMAVLAVHDKKTDDMEFERFLPIIKREATDGRNFVKKAVNWALRQIGKRNLNLNKRAVEVAEEIQKMDSKAARWIATDATWELTSESVQKRLKN